MRRLQPHASNTDKDLAALELDMEDVVRKASEDNNNIREYASRVQEAWQGKLLCVEKTSQPVEIQLPDDPFLVTASPSPAKKSTELEEADRYGRQRLPNSLSLVKGCVDQEAWA